MPPTTLYQPRPEYYDVRIIKRPLERMIGLMADNALRGTDVLMLFSCKSIHSFGMNRNIDVAFIDSVGNVLKSIRGLPPNRLVSCHGAMATIERFSDSSTYWLKPGDRLKLEPPGITKPRGDKARSF